MGCVSPASAASNRYHSHLQNRQQVAERENVLYVTLRGHPVNHSNTGTWKAGPFVYAFAAGNAMTLLLILTLVTYLVTYLHQPISKAATITTNFTGTNYLLSILGGFIADSYLGSFWTILIGALASILGLGLLTMISGYSALHLKPCIPNTPCSPAGARYMAPVSVALYTIAFGGGLGTPNLLSLGADQFDDSKPEEKKQSIHFFVWFFFFTHMSILLAVFLGVYLVINVDPGWGYGFCLLYFTIGFVIFLAGFKKLRHRRLAGSFLTRTAQVLVAAVMKRNAAIFPKSDVELYEPLLPPTTTIPKLEHTDQLRFLDRAAVINEGDNDVIHGNKFPNPWTLCSVSQVEESKRILQLIPVWITTMGIAIIYSQLTTFTIQQAQTFDRKLGPHFTVPANSLAGILTITSLILVPIYDQIFVPFVRRFTKNPYGFSPLKRLGSSIVFAALTMMTAALVERKRLVLVRELHFQDLELGSYELPIRFWWLLPQYAVGGFVELTFFVSAYEFFYHESSDATRSIGSSFTFSAYAMGSFFSTILVEIVNSVTRRHQGDGWLEGQLNNGGLEKFYWLLVVLLGGEFLAFLIVTHFYRYKYDWYHMKPLQSVEQTSNLSVELNHSSRH
ncbi:unnamed protein product [Calypogeia fissa]